MNERRVVDRFPFLGAVQVRRATNPTGVMEGRGIDLSAGGLSLLCGVTLITGEVVTVSFALGDGEGEVSVALEVLDSEPMSDRELIRGSFYRPSQEVVLRLARWTELQRVGTRD